ncbi:acetyl-CoA synthetase-like protein [Trametes meyenii]|nr:acetyl-CoA synthetase-like protein [Trametes meyenii]
MPFTSADVPSHIATEFRAPKELMEKLVPVPELYDWNAKENPNYPLFTYHDGEQQQFITYSAAHRAIYRVARYVTSVLGPRGPAAQPPTVAVFANTDTITYFLTALGVVRAGCTAFLVSTRNASAGLADMLQRTETAHMFVSRDAVLREVVKDALSRLPEGQVTVHDALVFDDLFPADGKATDPAFETKVDLPSTYDLQAWAIILHSSGSTGHPKPIRWTHKQFALFGRGALLCEVDSTGTVMGCHGTPMFHGLGAFMYSSSPLLGYVVAAFKPASPPTFPTPDAVWQGMISTKSDCTWTVPSFVEEWATDPEKVSVMRKMLGIFFGGAPLNRDIGNALASQGIRLFTAYGLTEVGLINLFIRRNPGMDWEYYVPTPTLSMKYLPREDNKFELVVLSPPENPLPAANTKIDGQDAYSTSDLVEPHPTKPNLWRIVGRADEQIMLSNGEKTNPVPLEKIINADPHVKSSVMFGRGKFQNGILIEPKPQFAIDLSDIKQVEAFRNKIWPSVERANEWAPQHSRIFKEMILVTSPSRPFLLNMKGLPRRVFILEHYKDEIEALYKQVEDSSQGDLHPPEVWDNDNTLTFVRGIVERTLQRHIADDADIFRSGGDSLQATWIRNTIIRAVRESDASAVKRLPMNLVFKAPTISSLAKIIHTVVNDVDADGSASYTPHDLWKFVEKYSENFPARPTSLVDRPATAKEVVLITGTTGGFGCDALEHLLLDDAVERVYAFNRKGSKALERQHAQFLARGLDEKLLESPKFKLLEVELHEPGFGIKPQELDEVRRSITHIIHNAWKVDFNISLHSFEADIKGARNLIDLAIGSPYTPAPSILFASSVGVFLNYKGPAPAPEVSLDDPASAFGTGYSEGKWVTEHVLQNVTKQRGVHTIVMRLGQVSGNKVGYWNEKEWFPALVKTAQFQRCLPDVEGNVTWIQSYEAAKAYAELRHSLEPFVHLVHPRPVPWHRVVKPIAEALGVPLVPYADWLSALEKSIGAGDAAEVDLMKANPALRLLSFYKALTSSPEREPLGMVYLSTKNSTTVSETLANLPELDAERAKGWLAAWKRSGFL